MSFLLLACFSRFGLLAHTALILFDVQLEHLEETKVLPLHAPTLLILVDAHHAAAAALVVSSGNQEAVASEATGWCSDPRGGHNEAPALLHQRTACSVASHLQPAASLHFTSHCAH